MAAQKRQMTWLANGGQNGGQKQLEEDDQDAYNYYPQYHKKVSSNVLVISLGMEHPVKDF